MARKSRYNIVDPAGEKIYKTAVYARLSAEDSSKTGDGTIENQIFLVRNYVESKPYLQLRAIFADNGQTGTTFDREGFKNLMESVKCGETDCIAVKDLSRLGRDYIETGNYLEKVFPFLGVRFISINDGYDSHNPAKSRDNLTIILKNLINDIYAKDISRKVRSVYEIKQKKGEYTGNYAPYGYLKSQEDKHKLIPDEEAAKKVREIFQLKLGGMSNTAIARKLNEQNVLSPRNYLYSKNIVSSESYAKKMLWNTNRITGILSNPAYIGHMAQGKTKTDIVTGTKRKNQPREKWVVVENTHEPIIEKSVFYAVNRNDIARKENGGSV